MCREKKANETYGRKTLSIFSRRRTLGSSLFVTDTYFLPWSWKNSNGTGPLALAVRSERERENSRPPLNVRFFFERGKEQIYFLVSLSLSLFLSYDLSVENQRMIDMPRESSGCYICSLPLEPFKPAWERMRKKRGREEKKNQLTRTGGVCFYMKGVSELSRVSWCLDHSAVKVCVVSVWDFPVFCSTV